jgi:hypothetical protein
MQENILIPLLERHSTIKSKEELLEIYLRLFQKEREMPVKIARKVPEKGFEAATSGLDSEKDEEEMAKTLVLERKKEKGTMGEHDEENEEDEFGRTLVLDTKKTGDAGVPQEETLSEEQDEALDLEAESEGIESDSSIDAQDDKETESESQSLEARTDKHRPGKKKKRKKRGLSALK